MFRHHINFLTLQTLRTIETREHTTPHQQKSKYSEQCVKCKPSAHKPSPQPSPSHNSPAKKFVQKLPNFVKPTVSKDHKLSAKNFVEFKCAPLTSVSEKKPEQCPNRGKRSCRAAKSGSSSRTPASSSSYVPKERVASESDIPTSSTSSETIDQIDSEISRFEKEIGNVLESLTQSESEQDINIKKVCEGKSSLSMIGMKHRESPDVKGKTSEVGQKLYRKHSYTRLNSRLVVLSF